MSRIMLYKPGFFNFFWDLNNIKFIFCTVGDHRSNGLVEKLVHTVKFKLLAIAQETRKCTYKTLSQKLSGIFDHPTNRKANVPPSKYILIENQTLFGNNWLLVNHPIDF